MKRSMNKRESTRLISSLRRLKTAVETVERILTGGVGFDSLLFRLHCRHDPRFRAASCREQLEQLSRKLHWDCVELATICESVHCRSLHLCKGAEYVAKEIQTNKVLKDAGEAAGRFDRSPSKYATELLLQSAEDGDDSFFRKLGEHLRHRQRRDNPRRRGEPNEWQRYIVDGWLPKCSRMVAVPENWPPNNVRKQFWVGFCFFTESPLLAQLTKTFQDKDFSDKSERVTRDRVRSFLKARGLLRSRTPIIKDAEQFPEVNSALAAV